MQTQNWDTAPAPDCRQIEIYFRKESYSAFPHVVRLEGDELLLSFREAPRVEGIRHTHPRSIITIIRSYDGGATWDIESASQVGAGGGQEFGLVSFGQGHVAGVLAWHEVVPMNEKDRTGVPFVYASEYPFRTPGVYWIWSETYGFTWPLHHMVFFGQGTIPCAAPHVAHDGTILCPVYGLSSGGMSSVLYRSDDKGRSWSEGGIMAQREPGVRDYCEPCVVEIEPRILRTFHRVENSREGGGCFWSNVSRDSGMTWSEPENTNIRSGACPRLLRLADGRLLLTFGRRFPPYSILAMLSGDGGVTWGDTAWVLRTVSNRNQGYTSSVEIAEGRMLTVSYAEDDDGITGIVGTFWDLPR